MFIDPVFPLLFFFKFYSFSFLFFIAAAAAAAAEATAYYNHYYHILWTPAHYNKPLIYTMYTYTTTPTNKTTRIHAYIFINKGSLQQHVY
jgi:hypothetical protein